MANLNRILDIKKCHLYSKYPEIEKVKPDEIHNTLEYNEGCSSKTKKQQTIILYKRRLLQVDYIKLKLSNQISNKHASNKDLQ